MGAPSSGTSPCGAYAGQLLFDNNGNKFTPDASTTTCVANVQAGGSYVPNTDFYLLWYVSPISRGCAANVSGSTTDKSFASSPSKQYTFTVYFKSGCVPAQGTEVTLTLNFS